MPQSMPLVLHSPNGLYDIPALFRRLPSSVSLSCVWPGNLLQKTWRPSLVCILAQSKTIHSLIHNKIQIKTRSPHAWSKSKGWSINSWTIKAHNNNQKTQKIKITSNWLVYTHKKRSLAFAKLLKEAASYSPTFYCSTIGVNGLNFSVRNGKRWNPVAITTQISSRLFCRL